MANASAKVSTNDSSWAAFTQPSGGSTSDIRRSSAVIRNQVTGEIKIFSESSLINGGTRTISSPKKK